MSEADDLAMEFEARPEIDSSLWHDHPRDERDPWSNLEGAALEAHQLLVAHAGAFQEPTADCPWWAHKAAMLLLEALDDVNDCRTDAKEAAQ